MAREPRKMSVTKIQGSFDSPMREGIYKCSESSQKVLGVDEGRQPLRTRNSDVLERPQSSISISTDRASFKYLHCSYHESELMPFLSTTLRKEYQTTYRKSSLHSRENQSKISDIPGSLSCISMQVNTLKHWFLQPTM